VKLLVTGSHGLLGTNIIPVLKRYFDVISLDIEEWDITDEKSGQKILQHFKPHTVINLAAFTDVDGCEDNQEHATRINSEGPGIVAGLCRKYAISMVHFSTDYIFDGNTLIPYKEDDRPNPLSVYGMTKLQGERNVLENHLSPLIIRTQWLYGDGGEHFISKLIRVAKEKGIVEVVNDQIGSPTYAKDLAEPLLILIKKNKSGIYHITNTGSCSWFEFAQRVFDHLHMNIPVRPISSDRLNRKAKRPRYSVFDCSKVQQDTNVTLRLWQEALKEYCNRLL